MTNGKLVATVAAITNSLIAQIRTIAIVAGAVLGVLAIISLFAAHPLVSFLHLVSYAGVAMTLFAVAAMILTFKKARAVSPPALLASLAAALTGTFVSMAFAPEMPNRTLVVLALLVGGGLGAAWSRTTLFYVDGRSIRMRGTVWYLAVWALTLVINQMVTILTGRPPMIVAALALLGAGVAIGNTAGLILRAKQAAALARVALTVFAVCLFGLSTQNAKADDGAWVLQKTTQEVSGAGSGSNSCAHNKAGVISDGSATFTQVYGGGLCGGWEDEATEVTSRCVWQSPPNRIIPNEKMSMPATVSRSSAVVDHLDRASAYLKVDVDVTSSDDLGISSMSNTPLSKDKTLTFVLSDGGNYEEVVNVTCQTAGGSGSFLYHYAYQAGGAAVASYTSAPGTLATSTRGDGGKAAITAVAAVLGGLLVSFGAAVAAGLAGIGQPDLTSTLSDLAKGKLPGDGFHEWKNRAGTIYGSGAPDDPYRDYPDADNPPWKAPYGDGTAAHPYSDTAPPEPAPHTYTGELHPVMASGDGTLIGPATTDYVRKEELIDTSYRAGPEGESIDDPVKREGTVPDAPTSPEDHIDRYGEPDAVNYQEFYDNGAKLDQTSKKLQEVVDQLKADGYYIANPAETEWGPLHVPVELAVKLFTNVPHEAAEFADWLKSEAVNTVDPSIWSDPKSPYYKSDPAEREELEKALHATIADPHFTQCGQAVELGRDKLTSSIQDIFGPDAVFTQISITSNTTENWNHVANEVILPNGERYVVDLWASMVDGKPRIYREDKWIEKWKNDTWVGSGGSSVTRGAPGKEFEGQLETSVNENGVEEGIKKARAWAAKHSADGGKSLETVIKSYRAYPWQTKPPEAPPPTPHTPGMSGKFRM